jgi:hypothetical protein
MLTPDNREFHRAKKTSSDGITIGELVEFLDRHRDLPLVFTYDGHAIRPGYHVTEVKAGEFSALDCGANPESWSEIFVQLWDVDEDGRTHMPSGKFSAIVRKVTEHVSLDMGAKLTFEVSDGLAPMQLHKASAPVAADGAVRVQLAPRAASCKPRDRWLAGQIAAQASCCGPPAQNRRCCN